ncbi:membrane dipeptidase [Streptomyces sp. NPDC050504]|uniref:membrane dipeptidase n=1 Tax=Streptomyces sp. NPDC050504 TaxID=3365618 RepID=UPI0037A0089F
MADLQEDPYAAAVAAVGEPDAPVRPEPPAGVADPAADPLARARALLAAHPVADGHNGLALALRAAPWCDLELGETSLQTDVPRLRAGGVGAQFWSLEVEPGADPVSGTLEQFDLIRSLVAAYPEALRLALSADDMTGARNCGRVASLLGPVRGVAIAGSLGTLRAFHALGIRSLRPAGASWAEEGLTRFGQEAVRELNRLGVVVDLTGASAETARQTLAIAKAPVLMSAAMPPEVLGLLAANGGACQVDLRDATVREAADRVDRARTAAGPAHVALAGGYDTGARHVPPLHDAAGYPHLIAELLDRGWEEAEVAGLTWENTARVVRGAEFAARAAQCRRTPSRETLTSLDG